MKYLIFALLAVFVLSTGLHAEVEGEEKNIFNKHERLNSCDNFDPLSPLVAEVVKETQEVIEEALQAGLSPETIMQMARNAKCVEFILPLTEEYLAGAQPYTPEEGPTTVPGREDWETNDTSPHQ